MGSGPTLVTSIYLHHFFKGSPPQIQSQSGAGGQDPTYGYWGTEHNQSHFEYSQISASPRGPHRAMSVWPTNTCDPQQVTKPGALESSVSIEWAGPQE